MISVVHNTKQELVQPEQHLRNSRRMQGFPVSFPNPV